MKVSFGVFCVKKTDYVGQLVFQEIFLCCRGLHYLRAACAHKNLLIEEKEEEVEILNHAILDKRRVC